MDVEKNIWKLDNNKVYKVLDKVGLKNKVDSFPKGLNQMMLKIIDENVKVVDFDSHSNLMRKEESLYYKLFMEQARNSQLDMAAEY